MALSVTVHGITIKTGIQTSGRQATADIATETGTPQLVHTVSTAESMKYAILAISITNRSNIAANNVGIAISPNSSPAAAEYIEWNTAMVPNGVLERTQITASPGDNIFVRWGTTP